MSLADFIENMKTPGFVEDKMRELSDIFKETGKEFKELSEEGHELFTEVATIIPQILNVTVY